MILQRFQFILMPVSFGLLFSLMLLYWGQAAIFSYTKYKKTTRTLFYLSFFTLTFLLISRFLDSGHLPLSNLYESLLFLSWSFLVIQFFLQSNSYMVPNSPFLSMDNKKKVNTNSNSFLAATNKKVNNDTPQSQTLFESLENQSIHLIGVITLPMSFLTYSFAFLNLPKEMQKSTSLVPALQSNWLMMHVTVMILSYAALLCGAILSMAFLFLNLIEKRNFDNDKIMTRFRSVREQTLDLSTQTKQNRSFQLNQKDFALLPLQTFVDNHNKLDMKRSQFFSSAVIDYKMGQDIVDLSNTKVQINDKELIEENSSHSHLSLADKLDNYSYRLLALGFPLLTVGILSGAVWANQAWGSYWSWDPKESWALITWLVFAIYLHARITKGWSGKKPAVIASVGFFVVWFCYLGVNLLGSGLHSYGWFSK